MSRPFRFVISVERDRDFEITGWGDDPLQALRDALWSNTTAIGSRFPLGDHAGFTMDDLRIEPTQGIDGTGGYDVRFHAKRSADLVQDGKPHDPWAIRASLSAV